MIVSELILANGDDDIAGLEMFDAFDLLRGIQQPWCMMLLRILNSQALLGFNNRIQSQALRTYPKPGS